LYGLKQAPRQWYERLNNFLLSHGYERGMIDNTLFIKKSNSEIFLVQIYVDDIIFGATQDSLCEEFVAAMKCEFEMSMMGELSFFLGLQVKQTKDGIFLCQSKYCKEILKKFEMESCKEASTPMSSSCYMDADAAGKGVDQTKYRGLIGSLLYLTTSRQDIMFVVCLCAKFQANPKESHIKAAKRILKYLKGTSTIGLWYPSHSPIHLIDYSDSDFGRCKLDRKSTSGTCHLLGSSLISWHSKKQACVALSTAEAEYIVARSCCAQFLSAINLTKNQIQHSRTKHILFIDLTLHQPLSIARHVDVSTTIILCRLRFSQRSGFFKTLKHFALLQCFIIFFLTPNSRNTSASASTPSISILPNTFLIINR